MKKKCSLKSRFAYFYRGSAAEQQKKKTKQINKSQFFFGFFFILVMHPVFTGNKHNLHGIFFYTTTVSDCSTWKRFLGHKKYVYAYIYLHILVRWKSKGKKRVSAFVLFGAFSTAVPAKTLTVHLSIGSDTHINSTTTASRSVY